MAPLSVWPTGQRDPLTQLRDAGYAPGTETDTERIPPEVAAHAIAAYSRPGDLVLDPDCGAGTVLAEALRAGRHVLGLTAHSRWWKLARANITAAKAGGAWCDGSVLDARPKVLSTVRAAGLLGRAGLILTSVRTAPARATGTDSAATEVVVAELATTLVHCEPLLRSGGYVAVVSRPRRRADGSLTDLTTPLIAAGVSARLAPIERCIALTAELRGSHLVTHASLAERRAADRSQTAVVAHLEVLVLQLVHDAELAAAEVGRLPAKTVASPGCGRAA
ncbi:DNA methyltransferase [Amycolatopsis sp. NPDC051758]|uniref:DNA methyltransferase n=1 Tax=Amycolatopsis sp. NPDC051758 TaxID=3363935 RepID=UPI0037B30120